MATKTKTAKADETQATDILGMLGDVKMEENGKKESSTPKVVVDKGNTTFCEELIKFCQAKKEVKDAEQRRDAAAEAIDPLARSTQQDKSRLDKVVHKSIHLYEEKTMAGATYGLGRFSQGEEAKGAKLGAARDELKNIFGADFDKYFAVAVALSIKEDACTAETIKLLKEKLGVEMFNRLFVASPCLKIHTLSAEDKLQKLMADYVMDDGVQQKVEAAYGKKLLKRGYDYLK